ncbi:uncharacterized protein PV09_04185 [Verruconis gallopava]|uniref:Heterokaryon incompatibility domain-containing protein n=1 Tax=Verruconis gallopava TaxID=253628 RepID=A0A0D2B151_9PEZI|nr:uncharacterized protein PV09_04185 [Verruconis gallopava]KIW05029.1 hypothetical protein PV09_04185 [Verruconis gallopava]
MAGYAYKPLKLPHETRVLNLLPGQQSDPLSCFIEHIAFDSQERQPYEALSYCWSSSHAGERPQPVTVFELGGNGSARYTVKVPGLYEKHPDWYVGKQGTIVCDGTEVAIGSELHAALARFRHADRTLRI